MSFAGPSRISSSSTLTRNDSFCVVIPIRFALLCLLILVFQITVTQADAAPVWGEVFALEQPDGVMVETRIWGDEFYQVVESLDGFTLIRDPRDGVICYAKLSPDGNELESTGARLGTVEPDDLGLSRHLRINEAAARAFVEDARRLAQEHEQQVLAGYGRDGSRIEAPSTGVVQGLCLLIDFDDQVAVVPAADIEDYCNLEGYTGYGNNGSVRDYFHDISDGNLTYTNYVPTTYYRANYDKSYYDDCSASYGQRARQMILEALNDLNSQGFDFSEYDSNNDGVIDGINCFYAGLTSCGWAQGLWPHSGTISFFADGVSAYRYQVTGLPSAPTLGTFCHENGHMLCFWPDLYDYDGDSRGVGRFCVMCAVASSTSPQEPCAYLKHVSGWSDVHVLETYQQGVVATADSNVTFLYPHPTLSNEYYLIENRQKSGRDFQIPDDGLAIWHIDTWGNNSNQEQTLGSHYLVTLVQADGRWDLENNSNSGDSTDLWSAPSYTECTPDTDPNTDWWDGRSSSLAITQISASGQNMSFTFNPEGQAQVPGQYATIQAAIDASANGTTIVLADGTYTGPGNRDLHFDGKAITVRSQLGDPAACVIDCQGSPADQHRGFLFEMGEGVNSVIENLTITGGYMAAVGGGIACVGASPTLRNVVLDGNESGGGGGGASFTLGSQAVLENCVFMDNTAHSGGGMYTYDASPQLTRCTFYGNSATAGSGVASDGISAPVIDLSIIASGQGGGAVSCLEGGSSVTLGCSDIFGNLGGNWIDCIAGQLGDAGNFSLDPIFCDAAGGDLTIRQDSPCAPGFHPGNPIECAGETIGALDVGCLIDLFTDMTDVVLGGSSDSRGAAWGDYDGDGDDDLYIVNFGQPNRLLRNDGGGTFTDATISPLDDAGFGQSAAWGDYDNDGDLDLYLANQNQPNHLLRNLGGGSFTDVTTPPLDDAGTSMGVSWIDYDEDGNLDLYVVDNTAENSLYRNLGDIGGGVWFFLRLNNPVVSDAGAGVGASWADYNNDGLQDIYIANDGANKLIANWGVYGFVDDTGGSVVGNTGQGLGSSWGDFDNDGYLDLYVVNNGQADVLLQNGLGGFSQVIGGPLGDAGSGRAASWADYNNDGLLDLYLCRFGDLDELLLNVGNRQFFGFSVGGGSGAGNSIAWCDYDGDGLLDLYIAGAGGNTLLRNSSTSGNHWLQVDLRGTFSNTAAIGARTRVVAGGVSQIREVTAGSGAMAQNSLTVEFGLGTATAVDSLIVYWPSGIVQDTTGVSVDQRLVYVERDPTVSVPDATDLPQRNALHACFPNPFNPTTTISYDLAQEAVVNLDIYDAAGRRLRALISNKGRQPGRHEVVWNGRSDSGSIVAAGVYFYKLEAGGYSQTKRMVLVK